MKSVGSLEAGRTTLENRTTTRYAQAERRWRGSIEFHAGAGCGHFSGMTIGPFLDGLTAALTAAVIPIIHLKVFDSSATGWLKAAVCGNGEEPTVEGNLDASPASRHELLVKSSRKGRARTGAKRR